MYCGQARRQVLEQQGGKNQGKKWGIYSAGEVGRKACEQMLMHVTGRWRATQGAAGGGRAMDMEDITEELTHELCLCLKVVYWAGWGDLRGLTDLGVSMWRQSWSLDAASWHAGVALGESVTLSKPGVLT